MAQLLIPKSHFDNVTKHQREEMLEGLELDAAGNIVVDYEDKNYTHVEEIDPSTPIKAMSMFSGAGGLDIGAQLAGVDVISTLDNYEDSVATIRANSCFGETQIERADIRDINAGHYSDLLKKRNPEKLIVIGGPPCQPFSKAGYWVTNEKRAANDDPRNMIQPYFDILGEIKPDGFVLENVESILHPTNVEAVDNIKQNMEKLGYHYSILRINAAEHGIPQKRKRVFFLASKKPINAELLKTHGSDKECIQDEKLLPYEPVVNWIGRYNELDAVTEGLEVEGKWSNALTQIPLGNNYIALTERRNHPEPLFAAGKRYWSSLLKLHPFLPSWTIIASPGHWEGPFHWNNRRLSNREAASIQTFPADYEFIGSDYSQRKQIGNAVPPYLGKLVIEELCKWL